MTKDCIRCHEKFVYFAKERMCTDCIEKMLPLHTETDSWQYLQKGYGYRLIAGFNQMKGVGE